MFRVVPEHHGNISEKHTNLIWTIWSSTFTDSSSASVWTSISFTPRDRRTWCGRSQVDHHFGSQQRWWSDYRWYKCSVVFVKKHRSYVLIQNHELQSTGIQNQRQALLYVKVFLEQSPAFVKETEASHHFLNDVVTPETTFILLWAEIHQLHLIYIYINHILVIKVRVHSSALPIRSEHRKCSPPRHRK